MESDQKQVIDDSDVLQISESDDKSYDGAKYDAQEDDGDKFPVDRQLSRDFERLMQELD